MSIPTTIITHDSHRFIPVNTRFELKRIQRHKIKINKKDDFETLHYIRFVSKQGFDPLF